MSRSHCSAALLLLITTALPYGGPALCTLLQAPSVAEAMEPCPDHSTPPTGAGHPSCDLGQCATPFVAAPVIPLGLALALSIVELHPLPTDDDSPTDRRPPLTPPPIA